MGPLIEISTVPIQIEMKTTNAKLERASGTAEMEFSRSDKGVSVRSRSVRVNLDTYESEGSRTVSPITQMRQATYEAASAYTNQGQLMMTSHLAGAGVPAQNTGVPAQNTGAPAQAAGIPVKASAKPAKAPAQASPAVQNAVPAAAAELDVGEMSIRYEMDKLNFDWKFGQSEFEFTPGDIEFTVTQRPEVVIKYIGGPLYVPPSADPNYEGVDVTV